MIESVIGKSSNQSIRKLNSILLLPIMGLTLLSLQPNVENFKHCIVIHNGHSGLMRRSVKVLLQLILSLDHLLGSSYNLKKTRACRRVKFAIQRPINEVSDDGGILHNYRLPKRDETARTLRLNRVSYILRNSAYTEFKYIFAHYCGTQKCVRWRMRRDRNLRSRQLLYSAILLDGGACSILELWMV